MKNNKNIKYGSTAVAFTAAFIAIVVIVNVIVTALANKFSWYTDLTSSGIYSISKDFKQTLDSLFEGVNGTKINIVLMSEEDRFSNSSTEAWYLYKTLKQIDEYSDKISVKGINSTREKELVQRYKVTEYDTIYTNDVVFEITDDDGNPIITQPTKKYQISAFFKKNSSGNVVGYDAESRVLSAVSQLLNKSDKPIAYYVQGHGEPTLSNAPEWEDLLTKSGYEIKVINLATDNFDVGEENRNNDIIIINSPVFDLLTPTAQDPSLVNEKKKIDTFLKTNHGNMIVLEGSSTLNLPVMSGLLSEWGIIYTGSVSDPSHSASSSEGVAVMADVSQTATNTTASSLIQKAVGTNSNAHIIFSKAKGIEINQEKLSLTGGLGTQKVFSLLNSYSSAITTISSTETRQGSTCLAAMGAADWDMNDNGDISYVVAVGSGDFLSYGNSANESLILAVVDIMWNSTSTFENIQYKSFDQNSLSSTTAQANVWTIILVGILPAIVAAAGVVVWIRRRHS